MADFVYTQNYQNLRGFLEKLQTSAIGIPAKATQEFLSSLGYKSKNDRAIISVLRVLGFVDGSGAPTETWARYRNKAESRKVLGTAVRKAYLGLFTTYPDAYRQDNEALRNYFSTHTKVGAAALAHMVKTFKILAEMSDFEEAVAAVDVQGTPAANGSPAVNGGGAAAADKSAAALLMNRTALAGLPTVNINIQLQLPETANSEMYENFFAAMKKHLFS